MLIFAKTFRGVATKRSDAKTVHQPDDALATDAISLLDQIPVNARTSLPSLARIKRRPHQELQLTVPPRMGALPATAPRVEAAACHGERAT